MSVIRQNFLPGGNYFLESGITDVVTVQQAPDDALSLTFFLPMPPTHAILTSPELAFRTPDQTISFSALRRFALPAMFAWFGIVMGSWAGRIPALREQMQVSHQMLSLVLLCGGVGAVLSFPVSSRLMARFGGRHTMLISGAALLLALLGAGFAPSLPLLMMAVLTLGVSASCFDVGMNSVAARHEKITGASAMSRLHACVCAGGVAGAATGSAMAGLGISPAMHFLMLALPLALLLALGHSCVTADRGEIIEKKSFSLPRGSLALLGVLGFIASVAEGSIADWSGIFLRDHFGASEGFAPLSLTAFSTMMLLSRLFGDRLKMKHGARRLVCSGAVIAAAGLFFAVFAPDARYALVGFALAGLGLSLVFPFVFSAAGSDGPIALAGVATMAYSGTLIGPPLLGSVAHVLGMQAAMGLVAVLGILIALVAARTRLLDKR